LDSATTSHLGPIRVSESPHSLLSSSNLVLAATREQGKYGGKSNI
jgi:hypothetical protein